MPELISQNERQYQQAGRALAWLDEDKGRKKRWKRQKSESEEGVCVWFEGWEHPVLTMKGPVILRGRTIARFTSSLALRVRLIGKVRAEGNMAAAS